MQLYQLCPQSSTYKVPEICKVPDPDGGPYYWGYLASPSPRPMSMQFLFLLSPFKPPTFVNLVQIVGYAHLAGYIRLWWHSICPQALHLHSSGGEGNSMPKSQIC